MTAGTSAADDDASGPSGRDRHSKEPRALKRQLAEAEADPTSAAYGAAASRSNLFGAITLVAVLVIVVLMVTKPF